MIYDLEKAYALKCKTKKQLARIGNLIQDKIEKYQYMELSDWIEIDGRSINVTVGYGIYIYDRILSSRQKERPRCGHLLTRHEVMHINLRYLTTDELPWALKVMKYICGSFVIQKKEDDPDYQNAIIELFNEVSDMNKAVKELRAIT
jgi:hypothetical protein